MLVFLLACTGSPAPTETGDTGDTAAAACNWESPERIPLAWDAPASTGVTPEDAWGFGIGTLAFDVHWDDGVGSVATLGLSPTASYELDQGGETCPVQLGADVDWTVADGLRLALEGRTEWVADTAERIPVSAVGFTAEVDRADAGVEPLDAASTFQLSVYRYADDGHLTFVLRESWPIEAPLIRTCTRASNNPDALACSDQNPTPE